MAKKNPARKPINAKTKATLQKKAANSKYTYGQLAQVYRRGQGAYLSSGSKSASMAAWAMGRVNSFIRGGHSQDNDIKKKGKSSAKKKNKYEKGVPAKYLKNKKNSKSKVAAEIKRTAKAYKEGRYIDLKAVQKSRATRKKKR